MNAAPIAGRDGRYGLLVALDERDLDRIRQGRVLIWNGPDSLCNFQLMYVGPDGDLAVDLSDADAVAAA